MLLLLLLAATPAWAQTTGKITGTVTDDTGESLPGVNVLIDGTFLGAVTDIDGNYVIIGVRPGVYDMTASFIGFTTQRRTGVQVSVDLTTTVDFTLSEQVIEGEEIVVTADVITVRKDVTSSEARVSAETIDRLPVQEVNQVLNVQAGITDRGGLHIRGGRSSEVVFMVDGVPVTDSFDGSRAVEIENDGIQELQVISGTFNAEYGNAMSGVVNIVTKEGRRDRVGGSIEVYSGSYLVTGDGGEAFLRGTEQDEFSSQGIPYRDADVYSYLPFEPTHYANLQGTLEGPVFTDRLTFFGFGRYFKNDGWHYGSRIYNIDGTLADSSLVPLNTYEKLSWQGNLRYQLSRKMVVNLISLGSTSESRDDDLYWRWAPDGRPRNLDFGNDMKLKLTYLANAKTFYTVNLATFYRKTENRLFEDINDPNYNDFTINPPDSIEVLPGDLRPVLTGGGRFARGGTALNRFERSTRSFFAKVDVTSQIAQHHLVKVGLEARMDDLAATGYDLIPATNEDGSLAEPFQPAIPNENSFQYQSFDDVRPLTISAYVQDKIEYENFIVNAGMRVDYFDPRAQIPADSDDPNILNPFKKINIYHDLDGNGIITNDEEREDNRLTVADREAYWWEDADARLQVSPRLGIAYPITETGVIHFSWGHFLQVPTLNRMFQNFGYKIPNRSGTYGPVGNPALEAERTVMYEIGFRQGIGTMVFDITAYNRDVRSWVSTSPLIETELPGVNYVIYANRDYANTRGVTGTLSQQFTGLYGFNLSYTYQVVEGSSSNPDEQFHAQQANQQPTLALLPLEWDQRHKVAGSFFMGGDGWGASALAVWGSGFPYTPSFPEAALVGEDVPPEFPQNSRRIPSTFQIDLTVSKSFTMGRFEPRLYLQVFNVLDNRNPVSVYGDTGRPDITFSAPFVSSDPGYYVRPNHYAEPRRAQFGLDFKF